MASNATPRPGFVRLASGPVTPPPAPPAIGATVHVRKGHVVRGVVQSIDGETITCKYTGLASDPPGTVRAVWIDFGANYGLRDGDTFTCVARSIVP